MLNAKKSFSSITSPEDLQNALLSGSVFSNIKCIDKDGLNCFFNLLSRYGSDDSYVFAIKKPRKRKAAIDPELSSLKKEKEKQERAMQRLQDLYLYSERSISEKDYILRKNEIVSHLKTINNRLGLLTQNPDSYLTDE